MKLDIRSETRLEFDIHYGPSSYILRATDGGWMLRDAVGDSIRNLGSVKRLSWLGAVTSALKHIGAYATDRDGV